MQEADEGVGFVQRRRGGRGEGGTGRSEEGLVQVEK